MPPDQAWPAVSVIVTCFNLEAYVGEALRSVLAQDYPGNVELIVVDDASSDSSVATIETFLPATLVRRQDNGGVLQAMLDGCRQASHDLIFLLDGDDVWESGKLRACVAAMIDDPKVGFVTHSLSYIDGAGGRLARANRVEAGLSVVAADAMSDHLRRSILTMRDDVWLGSAMGYRRSLVDLDGFAAFAATLPDPRDCYQDWPLAYWIASISCVTLAYVPERLFRYRLHGYNHSGDAGSAARAERNFRRAANTIAAMVAIGERRRISEGLGGLRDRAGSYAYLASLYRKPGFGSVVEFSKSAGTFVRRGLLIKELIRLCAILIVGPDRFARWAARQARGLDLPTS